MKKEIRNDLKEPKEKCLYACEGIIDAYEYKKMVKYFPFIYWIDILAYTPLCIIASILLTVFHYKNIYAGIGIFIILEIVIMITNKYKLKYMTERQFKTTQKILKIDPEFRLEFYNEYFLKKDEKSTLKIKYVDIYRCVENDTNFYLRENNQKKIIPIQKNRCDLELIDFIREKFEIENHLGDGPDFKGVEYSSNNSSFVRQGMIILFVLTIASLWGGLYIFALIDQLNPQPSFNFTKNMWGMWCMLPIPLASIMLGFKYKKRGVKCTKNIVAGFIIGILLLLYGSFSLLPDYSDDYAILDDYKDIIDANLPESGYLEVLPWPSSYDEDKKGYTFIKAYYYDEDVTDLVNSIENSTNWIPSREMTSELKMLAPTHAHSDVDAYFSIYNVTTDEYNTIPEESGEYEVYFMKYDKSDKQLEIHVFTYLYKK